MEQAPRILDAALVALPETAGSALYGLIDVLSATGTLWCQLVEDDPGVPLIRPRIVSLSREPFRCGNGIPVAPDLSIAEAVKPDILILPELWLAPTDDLPALGVDSLDLVVASAEVLDRRLCAVIPAGQDRVYVAGYQRDGDGFKRTLHPTLIELAELDPVLTEWGGRVVLCAERSTIDLLRAAQAAKTPDHLAAVPDTRAGQLARLACERISEAGPVSSTRFLAEAFRSKL